MHHPFWKFATSQEIVFGRGSLSAIGQHAISIGAKSALVVADETMRRCGYLQRLRDSLEHAGIRVTIFSEGRPEPSISVVAEAIGSADGQAIDTVIGLGGGSNLDVSKATATVLRHGGTIRDYFGFDRIPGATLPVIAIPTTAGTGSEVSHSSVLTDEEAKVKVSTLSRWLRPRIALIDPELTDSCPPKVTADSGIDALVHAIEALTARDFTAMAAVDPQAKAYSGAFPLTGLIAREAIRLIFRYLPRAFQNGKDTEARDQMALAAMYAGMAFSNSGVAVVHALEYPIGAAVHCSHGEGNGLLLPHVMRFNMPERIEAFAEIARISNSTAISTTTTEEQAQAAILAVEELQAKIGIRKNLRQFGVTSEMLPDFANRAFAIKRLMDINPRSPTEQDLLKILEAAF